MARTPSLDRKLVSTEKPKNDEVKELKEQVASMKKMIEALQSNSSTKEEYEPIQATYQVRVMSLCPNKLNLTTERAGRGSRYTFERFGEIRKIPYQHLLMINSNHSNFKEAGYYIILDDRIVKEEGLDYIYEHVLTKDMINEVINNGKDAMKLFERANQKQQNNVIVEMLVSKIVRGEEPDRNLIYNIDRMLNPKEDPNYISIEKRANIIREANLVNP